MPFGAPTTKCPLLCRFLGRRHDGAAARVYTGVREAPRHEIAVGGAPAVPRALWGFGRWVKFVGMDCSGCRNGIAANHIEHVRWNDRTAPFAEALAARWPVAGADQSSASVAGAGPAGMTSVVALFDRRIAAHEVSILIVS